MKTTKVTVGGLTGINYDLPESIEELASLTNEAQDVDKGKVIVLHAANEHYKQQNLIKVRSKATEIVGKKFKTSPKLWIGKSEVEPNKDGTYKLVGGKKEYPKDSEVKVETDNAFFLRVAEENGKTLEDFRPYMQQAADEVKFVALRKRNRGGITTKAVGKKWIKLAEKIDVAGNIEDAAKRLSDEIGQTVDVSGEDKVQRLALAMAERERQRKEAAEKELSDLAGTEENPMVVAEA